MTFKQAFEIAYKENLEFRAFVQNIRNSFEKDAVCLIFAIGDETFYFGFDGLREVHGKHNPNRSAWLLNHDKCLIIKQKEGDNT